MKKTAQAAINQSGQALIRSLTKYHPDRARANILELEKLVKENPQIRVEPWQKADAITSAVLLAKHQNTNMLSKTFQILQTSAPAIPVAGIIELAETMGSYPNNELARNLWHYLKEHYHASLPDLTRVLQLMLRIFGQTNAKLAGQVLDVLAPRAATDPEIALRVMQTYNKLQDHERALAVANNLGYVTREIQGAAMVALAGLGKHNESEKWLKSLKLSLTSHELASLVRIKARTSIQAAAEFLDGFEEIEREQLNLKRRAFAQMILAATDQENEQVYTLYLAKLKAVQSHSRGLVMNLEINWALKHNAYEAARALYQQGAQNFASRRQLAIGLKMLKSWSHQQPADAGDEVGERGDRERWLNAARSLAMYIN